MRRKTGLWIAGMLLLLGLTACSGRESAVDSGENETADIQTESEILAGQEAADTQAGSTEDENTEAEEENIVAETENRQIRVLTVEGGTILFELNDSSASGDLYAQLPLTVQIEDFSTNEKIFYPEELDISDTPQAGMAVGTLAYYAPWGDVVMFYGEYNENPSLYELGHVVSGEELIPNLSGSVTIEAAD